METTEDRDDCKRALVIHYPDGEAYIIECCSFWQGGKVVGTRIMAAASIERRELGMQSEMLEPSKEVFDRIDRWDLNPDTNGLDASEVAWLDAEDEAGRLAYPIGAR